MLRNPTDGFDFRLAPQIHNYSGHHRRVKDPDPDVTPWGRRGKKEKKREKKRKRKREEAENAEKQKKSEIGVQRNARLQRG